MKYCLILKRETSMTNMEKRVLEMAVVQAAWVTFLTYSAWADTVEEASRAALRKEKL
jgi:hypothetical protein